MVAVEILSPREEIDRKLMLYFAHAALEVWVIDHRHTKRHYSPDAINHRTPISNGTGIDCRE
ncbi:MAG TPA: hypothetical protein VG345_09725 [Bryobacteraceae bacterium]|jgi:Uma2 family endonuclease|nr:hypothetical protein [Bryobacteraceae bacterium]